MRTHIIAARAVLAVLCLGACLSVAQGTVKKEALAFYYGWYGGPAPSGKWRHWEEVDKAAKRIQMSTHYPELGAYDSHDPKVVEKHCRWARQAGITGFIVSWWRRGDYHDEGLPLLLEKAAGHQLKITVYFEAVGPGGAAGDLVYLLDRYGQHPAWLKVDGKPVIFIYGRALGQLKLDGWREAIKEVNRQYAGGAVFIGDRISPEAARVFDGIHTYNPTGKTAGMTVAEMREWARATFPEWVKTAGARISCVTIIPGYNDTKLGRKEARPTTDRHDGETYRVLWQEAIAAHPDWVLITSFNEWHEGSEVEPSMENGMREIQTTRKYAEQFLKAQAR